MDARIGRWRLELVFGLLALALVALCARMGLLLREGQAKAAEMAFKQEVVEIERPARPGTILAKTLNNYTVLAVSHQAPSCFADPTAMKDEQIGNIAIRLGMALSLKPTQLQELFYSRREAIEGHEFVWIKRKITPEEAKAVLEMKYPRSGAYDAMPGVGIKYEWEREYPNAELAANVLGFRRKDNVAAEGVELAQDRVLKAEDGLRVVRADTQRRGIWPVDNQTVEPRDGGNVYLSIDVNIQECLQKALTASMQKYNAKWATGVVINPYTGDVLAMASYPLFDPNAYNVTRPEERANRAISMPYEPGSAFKTIYAAAAVNMGLCSWQTQFNCEGGLYLALKGGKISDHGAHYGMLSLADIIVVSSNIGMAKVGEMMGVRREKEVAEMWGFGTETNIGLPGESPGIVRDPLSKWDGYSLRRVPFGQEISVTALQLTMAYGAIANGGLLMKPLLVQRVTDPAGNVVKSFEPKVMRRVLKPQVAAQALQVMQEVVDDDRGTGKSLRKSPWTIGGKTGTAQIAVAGRGYVDGAFTGSFVGVAPATKPAVVCLISIYWPDRSKGHFGATVAAPYVRDVLEQTLTYMGVPPDRETAIDAVADSSRPSR